MRHSGQHQLSSLCMHSVSEVYYVFINRDFSPTLWYKHGKYQQAVYVWKSLESHVHNSKEGFSCLILGFLPGGLCFTRSASLIGLMFFPTLISLMHYANNSLTISLCLSCTPLSQLFRWFVWLITKKRVSLK